MFGLFKKRKTLPKPDRSMLVPRIKNTQFTAALKRMGIPEEQMPVTEPLAADLLVTYAFDLPGTFIMATPRELDELGLEPTELRDLAVENLKRQIPNISLLKSGAVFRVATGNNLDACTLLSRNMWSNQAKEMKGKLIAAVPNRDVVLFCDSESEEGLCEMRLLAEQAFEAGGTHALTLSFLEWDNGIWNTHNI